MPTLLQLNFAELEYMIATDEPMDFIVKFKRLNWPPKLRFGLLSIKNKNYTPLMFAVAYDRSNLVEILAKKLSREALDVQTTGGLSSLMLAAEAGNYDCVKILAKASTVNIRDNDGMTALMHAVRARHRACAELLMHSGSDISVESHSGFAPLHLAIKSNQAALTSHLIGAGASVNQMTRGRDITPLDSAVMRDDHVAVLKLLTAGADPNHHEPAVSPLTTAAYRSHFKNFKLLLDAGADVNAFVARMGSVLCISAYTGSGDILRLALSSNAMINLGPQFSYRLPRHFSSRFMLEARHEEEEKKTGIQNADQDQVLHDVYCPNAHPLERASASAAARRMDDSSLLLVAAGQDVSGIAYYNSDAIPPELATIRRERASSLHSMCREAIRGYMLEANPHLNLFQQVKKMNELPKLLQKYLVYDQTLEFRCQRCEKEKESSKREDQGQ